MSLLLPNKNGDPSTTRTVFWVGCIICLIKLAVSKMHILGYQFPDFSGSDFGVSIGALGGIYSLSKHVENLGKDN